jgi:hypothetical protein
MLHSEYYEILGLQPNCSIDQIKKAYREKARRYHPDINHSPDAKDKFIKATEAYDFLIEHHDKPLTDDQEFARLIEEWMKYRQERSRARARYFAHRSFNNFRNSKYYKSTREQNGYIVVVNFAVAIMVFIYTIIGYIIRLKNPIPDTGPPILSFLLLLLLSLILFTISFIYLKAFLETRKKNRRHK